MSKKHTFLILFFAILSIVAKAQLQDSVEKILGPEFSGQVCIYSQAMEVVSIKKGLSDHNWNSKINDSTLFDLGHVSQILIYSMMENLQTAGKVKFSDPVNKYLPDFPYPSLLINHLLEHRSGLPNNYVKLYHKNVYQNLEVKLKDKEKRFSNHDVLYVLETYKIPVSFEPGSRFEFNSLNYLILVSLIEQFQQKNIQDIANENLSSRFLVQDLTDSLINKVNSYQWVNNDWQPFDNFYHLKLPYTDGTIGSQHFYSSAKQLAFWANKELKIFFDSTQQKIPESKFYKGYFYNDNKQVFIGRGDFFGSSTYLLVNPKNNCIIALTSNEKGKIDFQKAILEINELLLSGIFK